MSFSPFTNASFLGGKVNVNECILPLGTLACQVFLNVVDVLDKAFSSGCISHFVTINIFASCKLGFCVPLVKVVLVYLC